MKKPPSKQEILENAQSAFWSVVAKNHPDIKTADLSYSAKMDFYIACARAFDRWKSANKPKDYLDILKALGFERWDTGGGHTALGFTRPDGQQCMVTNNAQAPKPGEDWAVGFYSEGEGEAYEWDVYANFIAALARIAEWRVG